MLKKSPSGSLCPYYYKGGELHPLKYGTYGKDSQSLLKVMKEEEEFVLASNAGRNVWIDLYDTDLDAGLTEELAAHICRISHKISRLALVGCSKHVVKVVKEYLNRQDCQLSDNIQHFKDPEIAKDWLIGRLVK